MARPTSFVGFPPPAPLHRHPPPPAQRSIASDHRAILTGPPPSVWCLFAAGITRAEDVHLTTLLARRDCRGCGDHRQSPVSSSSLRSQSTQHAFRPRDCPDAGHLHRVDRDRSQCGIHRSGLRSPFNGRLASRPRSMVEPIRRIRLTVGRRDAGGELLPANRLPPAPERADLVPPDCGAHRGPQHILPPSTSVPRKGRSDCRGDRVRVERHVFVDLPRPGQSGGLSSPPPSRSGVRRRHPENEHGQGVGNCRCRACTLRVRRLPRNRVH